MEALKLAFDTIIVGALALPWLILIIDLFLRPKGSTETIWSLLLSFLTPFKGQGDNATNASGAVAGVFLFVFAYFVGAAVTRVSADFFNDDDLGIPFQFVTESNIRTDVYCDAMVRPFARAGGNKDLVTTCHCQEAAGRKTLKTWWSGKLVLQRNLYRLSPDLAPDRQERESDECQKNSTPSIVDRATVDNAKQMIQRAFYRQEAALLLQGDKTDRLNQLHSQVLILRGAAFNGFITFVLSLLAINAQPERHLILWALPTVLSLAGFYFFIIHFRQHGLDDPPFMEFTILALGLAGVYMRWRGSQEQTPYHKWLLTGALLTLFAWFGWWWAEVFYDRLVLYSFYAMPRQ
jgi:hypothetical protein